MDRQDIERAENLRRVYEQNWLHARHVENERLWFTNIYAVVVAGSAVVISENGLIWPLATFLLMFSVLGFFMCYALRTAFIRHSRMSEIVLRREWQFEDYSIFYPRTARLTEKIEKSGERRKGISVNDVFYFFYILGGSVSAYLLMQAIGCPPILQILLGIFVFAVLFLLRRFWFKKAEQRIHDEMGEIA